MSDRAHPVVVTGLGAVSALGYGCGALWRGVQEGRGGLRPIRRFDTEDVPVSIGGLVPEHDEDTREDSTLCLEFARAAALEALDSAALGADDLRGLTVALVVGASMGEGGRRPCRLAEALGDVLGLRGPRITVSTACASSVNAIGLGRDLLRDGEADVVLAGGADVLTPELLAGFFALGVLSEGPCAPFSVPYGTSLGEGAGFMVLERWDDARRREAAARATVLGYGLSGDAYHETLPHPRGEGVARALRGAIGDAQASVEEIDYVNAHGTGTMANDAAEWTAIRQIFGSAAEALPVSSTKGHIGHAQGAAGALEAITTVIATEQGVLPPTLNFSRPRPMAPNDPVSDARPRPHPMDRTLCTNSAFGGANCAVVFGRPNAEPRVTAPARTVFVTGAGAIGPHGADLESLLESLLRSQPLSRRSIDADLAEVLPHADTRGLDPAAVDLTYASTLALRDAGVSLHGAVRERAGLVVGITRTSPQSVHEFHHSRVTRGLARVSTNAFARLVLNASQGSCAKLLDIRGPQTTVATGTSSALTAIGYAGRLISLRRDVDIAVAGGVEEIDVEDEEDEEDDEPAGCEGSACLVLSAEAPGDAGPAAVILAGWSIAGPGEIAGALGEALARARVKREEVGAVFGPEVGDQGGWDGECTVVDPSAAFGRLGTVGSAVACAAGVAWLRRENGSRRPAAVVLDPGDRSASCALVLTRKD